jgi:hypothetical protein
MDSKEMQFAIVAATGLVAWLVVRWFITLIRKPATPDPWGPEVAAALEDPNTTPLCPHCQCPHDNATWFCPECGRSVGEFNNITPYLYLFSLGETLREGTSGRIRKDWVTVVGFVLLSLIEYAIFAPVYWFFLFRNLSRQAQRPPGGNDSASCAPANLG